MAATADCNAAPHALESFFWPDSIALIGAAPAAQNSTRSQMLRLLRRNGYRGAIYPINPSYTDIDGLPCYAAIDRIGRAPDLALIAVPATLVPGIVAECAAAGTRNAIVMSSGFAEEGESGRALQWKLRNTAARTGMRIAGPNCQGLYNSIGNIAATFTPTVDRKDGHVAPFAVSARRIGVISQSGGIGFSLFARGYGAGLQFSYVVSTGNEADITLSDCLDYMVHDRRTDAVMIFLEAVRDAGRFMAAAEAAQRAKKPIVAVKIGRSAAGVRAAASHTAALTGWHTAYRAVFDRYGIIAAEHPDEAVAIVGQLVTGPLPAGRRVGVMSVSGGGGGLMADGLETNGLIVPELSESLQRSMRDYLPAQASPQNPIDVTLNRDHLVMPTLERLEASDEIDQIAVVIQLASESIIPIVPHAVRALVDRAQKPIAIWSYTLPSENGRKAVAESGLFLHLNLGDCVRALGKIADCADRLRNPPETVAALPPPLDLPGNMPRVVPEYRARSMLAAYGLPPMRDRLAQDADEAVAMADALGYPVAIKIQSQDIPHKTEIGGVRLGLPDADRVRTAFGEIVASARHHRPAARIDGLLVQPMAPKGFELAIGTVNDTTFGPIVMVGFGGTAIELFGDVVHSPAPVSEADAAAMIERLKSARLLKGFRGTRPVDIAPVARLVAALSLAALANRDRVAEIELNPVIVHADGSGLTVADALMILKS